MNNVQVAELLVESKNWKAALKGKKEHFTQLKSNLLHLASKKTEKEVFPLLEHFQNQFFIQLLNIHDLKQRTKLHIAHLEANSPLDNNKVEHHKISEAIEMLNKHLALLKTEFDNFVKENYK